MAAYSTKTFEYNQLEHGFFQKFAHLPGFVLLQSTDKMRGRYDIISAFPYERIIIEEHSTDSQKSIINKLIHALPLEMSSCDLPFQGGAIGYISYDFGASLFDIKSAPQESLKGMPLLDLGLYDWAIIVDHLLQKVTLFSANAHSSTADIIEEISVLWNKPMPCPMHFALDNEFIPLISKTNYKDAFAAIHQSLREGRAYQVNLTQPYHASFKGDTWSMYQQIIGKNPVPFSAFLKGEHADILCFSPERFLLYDQGTLLTSPIKGTIGRSSDVVEDNELKSHLALCAKNRAENIMIVDLLRNDLGKIAKTGTVSVSNLCAVQSYNSVHHLVSDIEAVCIDGLHPFEAFLSCFPGGSITGAPKRESMNIINEQERYGRGVYCGSIGYFSRHGRFDSNIAIRTVTAKEGVLHLAAGGGIVIDSKWEDEYRECLIKIAAVINGLK